jgi:sugar phosphate isomerase/epimerase
MSNRFESLAFKIGAPSMVFGDDMVENAEQLAEVVNHVEIVLFFTPELHNIPGNKEIHSLKQIQQQHEITYSVHLPASLEFGAKDTYKRDEAIQLATEIGVQTAELDPINTIMHIPFSTPTLVPVPGLYFKSNDSKQWQDWTRRSLESLTTLSENLAKTANLLVENINYSPSFLEPFIKNGLCGLCLDIGHLLLGGESAVDELKKYMDDIEEIHIHGVKGQNEHLCVSELPFSMIRQCVECLQIKNFTGVVNLEIFSPDHLFKSIEVILNALNSTKGDQSDNRLLI